MTHLKKLILTTLLVLITLSAAAMDLYLSLIHISEPTRQEAR